MSRTSFLTKSVMLALAVVLVAGSTSFAQDRQRQRGNQGQRQRGGFGFGGSSRGLNQSTLLRAEQVQKELKISEDQQAKITELNASSRTNFRELFSGLRDLSEEERRAKFQELRKKMQKATEGTNKKLAEILTADQNKRLGEILLQQQGVGALASDKIGTALKITAEQKEQIEALVSARREMEQELFSGISRDLSREERTKKFEELRGKREEIRTETDKAVLEVLTAAQRTQFEQMKGKKFELDRSALFRGFGGNRGNRGGRPGAGGRPGGGNRRPGGNNGNRNRRPDA